MELRFLIILILTLQTNAFLHNKNSKTTTTTKLSKSTTDDIDYPETETVRFRVFTSAGEFRTIDTKLLLDRIDTTCSARNSRNQYKLIVHGFAETWNMSFRWNWVSEMKREMLESRNADRICFIAVDWESLAKGSKYMANYWRAIENMQIAAELMSDYLNANRVEEAKMHCVGFSLGAHLCSIFGKTYYTKFGKKIGRITGLDPAGPFFRSKPTSEKLYHTDATLVDIIHTSEQFGLAQKNGHMDFYPDSGPSNLNACGDIVGRYENLENVILYEETTTASDALSFSNKHKHRSEKKQTQAEFEEVTLSDKELNKTTDGILGISTSSISTFFGNVYGKIKNVLGSKPKRVFIKMHQFFGCSHLMAMRYFIYSINDCEYKSVMCKSRDEFNKHTCPDLSSTLRAYPRMGFYADEADEFYRKSMGNFFLKTSEKPPYCIKKSTEPNEVPRRSVSQFFKYFIEKLIPNATITAKHKSAKIKS